VSTGQGGESPLEAVLQQLAELRDQVSLLEAARQRDAERIDQLSASASKAPKAAKGSGEDEGYKPIRAPRWWQQRNGERGSAVARLRSWVETVYRPG
jgi:hypothetical protein